MAVQLAAPPPGATVPGDLYVDLATKTIWIGVATSIDPNGAVLLSDINNMAPLAGPVFTGDARAVTPAVGDNDTSIATTKFVKDQAYAPKASPVFTGNPQAPTPATTDSDTSVATTGFVKAAIAAAATDSIPIGMIAMYSGNPVDIGTGIWAKWHLCDGTVGTPNLKDKFIFSSSSLVGIGHVGADFNNELGGIHTHTINGAALTLSQIPSHAHAVDLTDTGTDTTTTAGSHVHGLYYSSENANAGGNPALIYHNIAASPSVTTVFTVSDGPHNHSVDVTINVKGNTGNQGGGGTHTHTAQSHNGHVHLVDKDDVKNALDWFALAYVMKIA